MFGILNPSATLSANEIQRSLRLLRWDSVMAGAMFSLGSGGFMAAYALALGANNLQVGILAALPPIAQVIQLPAVLAVERFRRRKAIGLPAWFLSQLVWLPIGAVPFVLDTPGSLAITAVIILLALRGLFNPVWVIFSGSWLRDLVPPDAMGRYHGQRLALMTTAVVLVGLGGSLFVQWWQGFASPDHQIYAYSFLLIGGWAVFGLASPSLVAFAKEPLMPAAPESNRSTLSIILDPLRDRNFRRLFRFLIIWNFALNLAVPFFAVYMLTRLGLSLPMVIGFTMLSQVTNVLFVRVWGAMADRLGSKTVMSLSASLYLLVIIGWIFTTNPEPHVLTVPLLVALHIFAGVAAAGVLLTVQTLALKTAPTGKATPYVGLANIATGLGAGISPIIGGALADFFSLRLFRIDLSWASPSGLVELPALTMTGHDFLFVVAFALGLLSLNLLATLQEEGAVGREVAMSELTAGMGPVLRAVSSVPGVTTISTASYGYLRRVPGADVALGVVAYELASSTQAAVGSVGRSRNLAADVQDRVENVIAETSGRVENLSEQSLELARHATRGAIHAGDGFVGQLDRVTQGSVAGAVRALNRLSLSPVEALRGAGYGAMQGALESGHDPVAVSRAAIEAARAVASELGVSEAEAANETAQGILSAAAAEDSIEFEAIHEAMVGDLEDVDAGGRLGGDLPV